MEIKALHMEIRETQASAKPIRDAEIEARLKWDEILNISTKFKISDAVNAILTLNATSQTLISDLLNRNDELVEGLERMIEIDELLDKPTTSFSEQEHKTKKVGQLKAELKTIIKKIMATRELLLDEGMPNRNNRLISKMKVLIKSDGLTLRTASQRVYAEEIRKGRNPPLPDTIKKIYTDSNKAGGTT